MDDMVGLQIDDSPSLSVNAESILDISIEIDKPIEIEMELDKEPTLFFDTVDNPDIFMEVDGVYYSATDYEGPYTVVPKQTDTILPTANHSLDRNIIVEAIPKNYGLVEWDGNVLTIR